MKLIFFIFLFIPFAYGLELRESSDFVIITNNYETTLSYILNGKEKSEFNLEPNQSRRLDKGDFEIIEYTGDNIISSAYIGDRKKNYDDFKVIGIGLFLSMIAISFLKVG